MFPKKRNISLFHYFTSLLCIVVELAVGRSVALGIVVAVAVAMACIGLGATICTRLEIKWSPVCVIVLRRLPQLLTQYM